MENQNIYVWSNPDGLYRVCVKQMKEIEELKAEIEEYRDSTTWWSNRFKAVERDKRELKKEIERLKEDIKRITNICNKKIKIINDVREYIENNSLYEQDYDYDYEENLVEGVPDDTTSKRILLEILDRR